jgi:tRNA-dihydrouridine synthase A
MVAMTPYSGPETPRIGGPALTERSMTEKNGNKSAVERAAQSIEPIGKPQEYKALRLSVAPMMDWTDRHCRFFHRQMTRRAMLYTEMVTAAAVIHGPRDRLLGHDAAEHPLALQLGGSDPAELAQAVRHAAPYGYDEINLNVGCPSDRVQSGCFGAVLMERPALVAQCVAAMRDASDVPVTVKCRIGVDDQLPQDVLPDFIAQVSAAGVSHFVIHARKAWLQGLSPKENREVPPLDYDLVVQIKRAFAHLTICINGGVTSLAQAQGLLAQGLDGVMLGRSAYHDPAAVLIGADALWGDTFAPDAVAVADAMRPYIAAHLASGGRLHQITRHMLGLFTGRPGARGWRRVLSEQANRPGAGLEVLDAALAQVYARAA